MTRFESIIAVAIVVGLAALHSPVFGQDVVIGGDFPKADPTAKGKGKAPKPGRLAKPEEPPKPEEPTFTVTSSNYEATKEKAKESAILAAVDRLHEYLLQQDPPITRMPTVEMVRKMVIRHPKASEADAEFGVVTPGDLEVAGVKEDRYQVEIAIKVRPEHVRELRSKERSSEALWVLAGLAGLAAVIAGFFRVDAWTKGYLTSWLMLATVGVGCLLGGLWWWAK
jgi:hypothetical protein